MNQNIRRIQFYGAGGAGGAGKRKIHRGNGGPMNQLSAPSYHRWG